MKRFYVMDLTQDPVTLIAVWKNHVRVHSFDLRLSLIRISSLSRSFPLFRVYTTYSDNTLHPYFDN